MKIHLRIEGIAPLYKIFHKKKALDFSFLESSGVLDEDLDKK